jgi:hypothetical protein
MSGWSIPLDQLVEAAQTDLETTVRKATLDTFTAVVVRSPVGNPELWAANAEAVAFNTAVSDYNSALRENPANLTKNGRLKRGLKINAKAELPAGKGYVGGRFRANWNVSYGAPDESTIDSVDKQRGLNEAKKAMTLPIGGVTYLTNGLPYAHRLEYEGWSTQAPAGMVRISALEFGDYIKKAKSKG